MDTFALRALALTLFAGCARPEGLGRAYFVTTASCAAEPHRVYHGADALAQAGCGDATSRDGVDAAFVVLPDAPDSIEILGFRLDDKGGLEVHVRPDLYCGGPAPRMGPFVVRILGELPRHVVRWTRVEKPRDLSKRCSDPPRA